MRNLFYRALAARQSEEGVTVIEYGVTLALVSLVLGLALAILGNNVFDAVETAVLAAI